MQTDVIVDPHGTAHRFEGDGFSVLLPSTEKVSVGMAAGGASPLAAPADAMPDVRADVYHAVMGELEAFGDEFARLANTGEQKALAEGFGEFVHRANRLIGYVCDPARDAVKPQPAVPEHAARRGFFGLVAAEAAIRRQPVAEKEHGKDNGIEL